MSLMPRPQSACTSRDKVLELLTRTSSDVSYCCVTIHIFTSVCENEHIKS